MRAFLALYAALDFETVSDSYPRLALPKIGIHSFQQIDQFTQRLLFVVLDGVRSNRFEFQGDAQFQALLNLTSVGTFIGAVVAVILAKAILKTGWGLLTSLVMALAFAILWLHWLVPFWNSLNMNV